MEYMVRIPNVLGYLRSIMDIVKVELQLSINIALPRRTIMCSPPSLASTPQPAGITVYRAVGYAMRRDHSLRLQGSACSCTLYECAILYL